MTVILHVEDDPALAAVVALSLEGLGFHGKTVTAETVHDAEVLLDKAARNQNKFDLIISDMHLPDGTGLDLVRYVRARSPWNTTPMVILSGDESPANVRRAYALGANAYVSKSPPGRTINQVVNALYQHWIKDAVPTDAPQAPNDIETTLMRAMNIPLRLATLYQRLADKFSLDPHEKAFWLSRALCEANLVNVLGFVQQQLGGHTVESTVVDDVRRIEISLEQRLTDLEIELDVNRELARDEVYLRVIGIVSVTDIESLARSMGQLFPVIPIAVIMLQDFLSGHLRDLSDWIYRHTDVPAVQDRAMQLRAAVATMFAHP
jgi:CheY-like chemotaxis protein